MQFAFAKGGTNLIQEPSLSLLTEEEATLVEPSAVSALSQRSRLTPYARREPSPPRTWLGHLGSWAPRPRCLKASPFPLDRWGCFLFRHIAKPRQEAALLD